MYKTHAKNKMMYLRRTCQIVAINEKKEKLYVMRIIQYYYIKKM